MSKSVTVAATKIMSKYLNELKPENTSIDCIYYTTTTEFNYALLVGECWLNDVDYLWKTDRFRLLQVVYKPECYAMSRAITTRQLDKIFKVNKCKTIEDLAKAFYEEVEI